MNNTIKKKRGFYVGEKKEKRIKYACPKNQYHSNISAGDIVRSQNKPSSLPIWIHACEFFSKNIFIVHIFT